MTLDYTRDDTNRRINVVDRAGATRANLVAMLDRQAEEGTWQYSMLYEAQATTPLRTADLRELARHAAALARRHGPRGPEARVAPHIETFGVTRMYSTFAEQLGIAIHVFHHLSSAERWLDSRDRPTSTEPSVIDPLTL